MNRISRIAFVVGLAVSSLAAAPFAHAAAPGLSKCTDIIDGGADYIVSHYWISGTDVQTTPSDPLFNRALVDTDGELTVKNTLGGASCRNVSYILTVTTQSSSVATP